MSYIPRIVDNTIKAALDTAGAVVLRGAKAVGKTRTAQRFAHSSLFLDSDDPLARLALQQPSVALAGDTPRLLDEWQIVPELWNAVRHEVDRRRQPGQFILSGSVMPKADERRHSGAGRFRQILMRTLSLFESGHSSGQISLQALFANQPVEIAQSDTTYEQVISRIVSGGWPGWIHASEADSQDQIRSYIDDIVEHEFEFVTGGRRDPRRLRAYLQAVAQLTANTASYAAITTRMAEHVPFTVGPDAVPTMHEIAARLFLIEDQPAWGATLRSKTVALQTPKRHLTEPSLAAALLGAQSERLLREPDTLGFLFESQVVHDLRVYAQANGIRDVHHYRDTKGRKEIDIVIENRAGDWLAIEVKLSEHRIDEAAAHLKATTQDFIRPPLHHIVVIPTGIAHARRDGVIVAPLTTLGP